MSGNRCRKKFLSPPSIRVLTFVRPAYVAGVTNPIFESGGSWDLLFDVGSGRVIVSKDIHANFPPISIPSPPALLRSGTFKAESSMAGEDEFGKLPGREGSNSTAKSDHPDNIFMEDVRHVSPLTVSS